MFTIEYPNRPQRKSQPARYSLALVFSLLSKRVSHLADWIGLLHVDSREVASGSTLAMIHAVMGWPCAEITHRPARYRRRFQSGGYALHPVAMRNSVNEVAFKGRAT